MTTEDECYDAAKGHAADLTSAVDTYDRLIEHEYYDTADALLTSMTEGVLDVECNITWTILLGTGGPAYGIDVTESGATMWHQDWGTRRVHVQLPEELHDRLVEHFMLSFETPEVQ